MWFADWRCPMLATAALLALAVSGCTSYPGRNYGESPGFGSAYGSAYRFGPGDPSWGGGSWSGGFYP